MFANIPGEHTAETHSTFSELESRVRVLAAYSCLYSQLQVK